MFARIYPLPFLVAAPAGRNARKPNAEPTTKFLSRGKLKIGCIAMVRTPGRPAE
jgi:hypothetical protein